MKDWLLDTEGDLQFSGNDVAMGDADMQTAIGILQAATGEFKEAPTLGGNLHRMIGGKPDPFWKGNAKAMLLSQHIAVKRVDIDTENNAIEIEI